MTAQSSPSNLTQSDSASSNSTDRTRLHIDLRDPSLMPQLKRQASHSEQTLKALVNDVLERFLAQPTVFSDDFINNLDRMFSMFESLPMDQIYQLAETSHRSPDQMLLHLLMKGLTVYSSLEELERD